MLAPRFKWLENLPTACLLTTHKPVKISHPHMLYTINDIDTNSVKNKIPTGSNEWSSSSNSLLNHLINFIILVFFIKNAPVSPSCHTTFVFCLGIYPFLTVKQYQKPVCSQGGTCTHTAFVYLHDIRWNSYRLQTVIKSSVRTKLFLFIVVFCLTIQPPDYMSIAHWCSHSEQQLHNVSLSPLISSENGHVCDAAEEFPHLHISCSIIVNLSSQDRIRTCNNTPRTCLDGLETVVCLENHHNVNQLHHLTMLNF